MVTKKNESKNMLKIAWHPCYKHPLPKGHRFPMEKYELLPEQLMYEGTVTSANFFEPTPASAEQVLTTHHEAYWQKLLNLSLTKQEERKTGFPLSNALVQREIIIVNGTILGAKFALKHGVALNVAGGTHHAYTNRGEGFCLLNDIAVASNLLLLETEIEKILVVDLDVHQGNGTAEIFRGNDAVFTFSMHGAKNYPLHKEQSDLDIELQDGTDDATYLNILSATLPKLLDEVEPDFIVFQSGVDVLHNDKLGRLGLPISGCKKRDEIVFKTCYENNIPIFASMGGGYADKLSDIIEAHANTYRLAQSFWF